MNPKALNSILLDLISKRLALKKMGYDHPDYDEAEEILENLEDKFVDEYGDTFEEILQRVHTEFCPETDVLLPTAYLPRSQYEKVANEETGEDEYEIGPGDGVWITLKDFPNLDAKLVLLPSPPRLEILSMAGSQEVWRLS
ncbi:MAG: hypothetical protein QM669_06720 [Siphonobacter sp.]